MATVGAVLGLAGCSGGSAPTGAASPGPEPTAGPTTSVASPVIATQPAKQCLSGTWTLIRFVGASDQTYGTGEGGDVTVGFTDDGYSLRGAGAKPVTVTLAGQAADLKIDGRATGTYALDGSKATFAQQSATGGAILEAGGQQRRLTMDQVTGVVGLKGAGQVACTGQAMTITLAKVRLELARA